MEIKIGVFKNQLETVLNVKFQAISQVAVGHGLEHSARESLAIVANFRGCLLTFSARGILFIRE